MYCPKCGELNPESANFCKKCGAPFAQSAPQPPPAPTSGQQVVVASAQKPTSGFSIASLVLGILGFFGVSAILAIIFGAIGISQANKTGTGGKGMAIAGLVLGSLWVFSGIIWLILILAAVSTFGII